MNELNSEKLKESLLDLSKAIDAITMALEIISDNALRQPVVSVINGSSTILYNTSILSAISTLKSIRICANEGHLGDSYVLARKVRDDLYQYLFLRETFQTELEKTPTDLEGTWEDLRKLDENSFLEIAQKALDDFMFGPKSDQHKAATAWLMSELDGEEAKKMRRNYYEASKYMILLRANEDIDACYTRFFQELCMQQDRTMNNFVHSNGQKYLSANLHAYSDERRIQMCEELKKNIAITMIVFLSIAILISPSIIMSDDYIGAKEIGQEPEEDSQYWVASGIINYIDEYFPIVSTQLKGYLRETNKYGMMID